MRSVSQPEQALRCERTCPEKYAARAVGQRTCFALW
jgi:hypothetical protein